MANEVEIAFSLHIPLSYPSVQESIPLPGRRIFKDRHDPLYASITASTKDLDQRPLSHREVRILRDQIDAEYFDSFRELPKMSRNTGGKFTEKRDKRVVVRNPDKQHIANLDGGATIATLYYAFVAFGGTAAAAAFIKGTKDIIIKWLDVSSRRSATITVKGVKIELTGGAKLDGILEDLVKENIKTVGADTPVDKTRRKRSAATQKA